MRDKIKNILRQLFYLRHEDLNMTQVILTQEIESFIKNNDHEMLTSLRRELSVMLNVIDASYDENSWQKHITMMNKNFNTQFCNVYIQNKKECAWCGGDSGHGAIFWNKNSAEPSDYCSDECKKNSEA